MGGVAATADPACVVKFEFFGDRAKGVFVKDSVSAVSLAVDVATAITVAR